MQDNSAFVIGSIIGNRPLTTARQFAELTNCHNELRTWLFCSWPAIAARANSRTYARNACTTKPLPRYPPERGGDGRKERERERMFQRRWRWIDGSDPSPIEKRNGRNQECFAWFREYRSGTGSTKIMVMVTVLVIEWNNCFHLFESRMERVVGGGLVDWPVKGTLVQF